MLQHMGKSPKHETSVMKKVAPKQWHLFGSMSESLVLIMRVIGNWSSRAEFHAS